MKDHKDCHDTSNSRSNTKLPWTELELPPAAPLHWQREIGGRGVGARLVRRLSGPEIELMGASQVGDTLGCCQSIAHCPAGETEKTMGLWMIFAIFL